MNAFDILSQLIGSYSPSGSEQNILNLLLQYFVNMGFKPNTVNGNLVLLIKGEDNSKAIIFNAHVDTVNFGYLSFWKHTPLKTKMLKGRVYGLGASDMKASLTCLILLAKKLRAKSPKCDVWFSFVVKEELDGSGTKSFVQWFKNSGYLKKYKQVSAIVCEPTNLNEIALGNKGNVFIKITTFGDSGHGSRPDLIKENAILKMSKIISQIENNKTIVLSKYSHKFMGLPSLGITMIESSSKSANKFSDSCTLTLDFRFTANFNENIKNLIKKMTNSIDNYKIENVDKFDIKNAPFVDKDEQIVLALSRASNIQKFSIVPFSTDLPTFTKNGIPACIFGPGNPRTIHKPNEYCEVNKIDKCVEIFYHTVELYVNDSLG
jgi:acetylornithine deacetylase/succinyl-diaminopimelate desuccinylase-like protein